MTFQSGRLRSTIALMLMLVIGRGVPACTACWYWLKRLCPTANVVNATGIVPMKEFPAASARLPISRSVRPGFPSLKMTTPDAPAACAFSTFTPKLQPPRWIRAIRPDTKPAKSPAVHPLVEVDVGVGGSTMPRAGWIAAVAAPRLSPAPQSLRRL